MYYIIYYVRRTLGSDEIFVEDVTRTGRRHDDVRWIVVAGRLVAAMYTRAGASVKTTIGQSVAVGEQSSGMRNVKIAAAVFCFVGHRDRISQSPPSYRFFVSSIML